MPSIWQAVIASTATALPPGPRFDMAAVWQRLLSETYRWLAALPLLLVALLVVSAAWAFGSWLSKRAVLDRVANRNPFLQDLARTTVRWIVVLMGLVIALEIMNATALVGAVLGTAGVLGVALGFAFKDIIENYLAGILMSVRQPFAPRDHIVIGGNEGLVVKLTSRATTLMTLDGNHLRLPNALVFRSVILNYTRNPSRRFEFDVGIGVDEDLVHAQKIGLDELAEMDSVMESPPPRALIIGLGDSNVQMRYHGWVDQRAHDFTLVKSEAIRRVKLVLEAAGMDMPEPIYRVQMTERAAAKASAPGTAPRTELAGQAAAVDTRANNDIDRQIDQDQHNDPSADLLDPAAPRE